MNILFVSDRFPFPPKDGIEIPLAHLAMGLAQRGHKIHFGLIVDGGVVHNSDVERLQSAPSFLNQTFIITARVPSKIVRVWRELSIQSPFYYRDRFDESDLMELRPCRFDVIWASPDGCFGFCEWYRREVDPSVVTAIGVNESLSAYLFDVLKWQFSLRVWRRNLLVRTAVRPWSILLNERKYFPRAGLIHVQTARDKVQILARLPRKSNVEVVIAPNGFNEDLLELEYHSAVEYRTLVFAGSGVVKKLELELFLKDVWPRVVAKEPQSQLWVIGSDASNANTHSQSAARYLGFVPDLRSIMKSVSLVAVPSHQGTGLINRVLDGLAAGIPVVTYPGPAEGLEELVPGVHAEVVQNSEQMAWRIVDLLSDPTRLNRLSANGRKLVETLNTWERSISRVEATLRRLVDGRPSV